MNPFGSRRRNRLFGRFSGWLEPIGRPAGYCATIVVMMGFNLAALGQSRLQYDVSSQPTVVVDSGQKRVPLETIQCLSLSSTKKIMILGKDYSDVPEVKSLIGKSFNGLPVKIDNPGCKYVYINVAATNDRAVQLRGQPALIIAAVGVCEWATPTTVNPDRCSQKNVWFFQRNIPPFELISTAFKAFVEPQDRYWVEFRPGTAHESCTPANTKSIFFKADNVPADEPLVVATTIINLIRPEDWGSAKVNAAQMESSLYAVARVDKIIKGVISYGATTLYIKGSVGRCVHAIKVGDSGILVGSANDVSGGIVRFFPRLSSE